MYGWLFTSVLDLFVVLNAIQLYELCTIKPKGGYYSHEVLNSTYQVLTKFHKVCTKSLFCFRKKGSEKHSVLVKKRKTTVINVLIFNKLVDFQDCFLTFLTFYEHYKSLSKSQFWNRIVSSKSSRLLETKSVLFSFLCLGFLQRIQTGCKSWTFWLLFSENRKWIFSETKLSKNTEVRHSIGKWPRLAL